MTDVLTICAEAVFGHLLNPANDFHAIGYVNINSSALIPDVAKENLRICVEHSLRYRHVQLLHYFVHSLDSEYSSTKLESLDAARIDWGFFRLTKHE